MLLWLGLAVLTAAALIAVLHPLYAGARAGEDATAAAAAAVYRDQLEEIERDRARGLIAAGEAEAARNEIARRLLATRPSDSGVPSAATSGRAPFTDRSVRLIAGALALLTPVVALSGYLAIGSPQVPSLDRQQASRRLEQARIDQLVAMVETRLQEHPEDGKGWDVIAPVYMRAGRFADAASAYQKAIRLLGESPARLSGYAESTVLAANGVVTEPARQAYEKLASLDPKRAEPRFWLALAAEQDGKLDAAAKAYAALLADADPKAAWRSMVEQRLAGVRAKLEGPAAPVPPAKGPAGAASSPAAAPRGPSAGDIAAAERMTPADRQKMIEGMVAGLADRLARDGNDLAGWQRLIRAYMVLGRKGDATAALARARGAMKDKASALAALGELARTLGLET